MNCKRNLVLLLALAVGASAGLAKADPRRDDGLLMAAYEGQTPTVRALLAKGANLETRDGRYGMTPLMWAAWRGQLGTVRYLLAKGAKVNARGRAGIPMTLGIGRDYGGFTETTTEGNMTSWRSVQFKGLIVSESGGVTPLILAAAGGYGLTVRELLAKGADPNLKNPDGDTALMTAAFKGYLPSVQALLAKGADVNAVDKNNQSALMVAASQGHLPVVRALLSKGARAGTKASYGFTASMIARRFGFPSIAKLLQTAEAKEKVAARQAAKAGTQRKQAISGQPYTFIDRFSEAAVEFLN